MRDTRTAVLGDTTGVMVTIGRNVGNTPMSDATWQEFGNAVVSALQRSTRSIGLDYEVHYGVGTWGGVSEESAMFTTRNQVYLTDLYPLIEVLRDQYAQDAIFVAGFAGRLV